MNRKVVYSLLTASCLYWIALYLYVPTLPEYIHVRTASLAAVGVVLSMYGLWQGVARIPLGIAADATGRGKAFLILGLLLTSIGAVIMGSFSSTGALTFGRSVTGLSAATWVPMIVIFTRCFPAEQAVFATSLLAFSSSFGMMIATSLTGLLNRAGGYALPFYLAGGVALAAVAVVAFTRVPAVASHAVSPASVIAIFGRRDVLVPSFAAAIVQFGMWAVVLGFMPILARQAGESVTTTSLLVTVNIAAGTLGNLVNTLIVRKMERRLLLMCSFAGFGAGILLLAAGYSTGAFFAASAVIGVFSGFAYPTLMGLSIERVDLAHRTTAMGIHQAVYAMGMFTGPWVGGMLSDLLGIRPMFTIAGVFCFIGGSALILLHPRK